MKERLGWVSNSSTSSFIMVGISAKIDDNKKDEFYDVMDENKVDYRYYYDGVYVIGEELLQWDECASHMNMDQWNKFVNIDPKIISKIESNIPLLNTFSTSKKSLTVKDIGIYFITTC